MGAGLKRVAKLCGGLTVKSKNGTAHYDGDGRLISSEEIAYGKARNSAKPRRMGQAPKVAKVAK